MELYQEILVNALVSGKVTLVFENKEELPSKIVENVSYQALKQIKAVIEDDSLEDWECFMKIEAIVNILENIGSNGGSRHDF